MNQSARRFFSFRVSKKKKPVSSSDDEKLDNGSSLTQEPSSLLERTKPILGVSVESVMEEMYLEEEEEEDSVNVCASEVSREHHNASLRDFLAKRTTTPPSQIEDRTVTSSRKEYSTIQDFISEYESIVADDYNE